LISYFEAVRLVLANTSTFGSEVVALHDSGGRVLARDIASPLDMPIFTNSKVDGYAIRFHETNRDRKKFRLMGSIPAGESQQKSLEKGEAIRVFTGSSLPEGVDAVVMQEETIARDIEIEVTCDIAEMENIRSEGSEFRKGEIILKASTLVTPSVLSLIATVGISEVEVFKKPRAFVIGTGNELVSPGEQLKQGQIYDSNALVLANAVALAGALVVGVHQVGDDPVALRAVLEEALDSSDVILTAGGVSVGEHDHVRKVASDLGVKEVFWQVAMKPGKPLYFGLGPNGQKVFGLPGNPVSALVTYLAVLKPAFRRMAGVFHIEYCVNAILGVPALIRSEKGRAEFVRAVNKGHQMGRDYVHLHALKAQGSNMASGLAGADYLIFVPEDVEEIQAGEKVTACKIRWGLS